MNEELIHWFKSKHSTYLGDNTPTHASKDQLNILTDTILLPLEVEFGTPRISYGFTSPTLSRWLQVNCPNNTAPRIDQHASMEYNSKGNRICKRDGAACDFYIEGWMGQMDKVARYIIEHLPFDRLYYYGSNKPIHVSVGAENARYVQCRTTKHDGTRVAGRYAYGKRALELFS